MPKDQDVFDSSSLADPSTYATRFNVLAEEELGRGAIGHRHAPPTYSLPSGIHSKFGGHGSDPLLAPFALYQNAPNEGSSPSAGLPYPAWNKDSYGSTVMRTVPAGAPYGPCVYSYSNYGWGIIAPVNSSTGAAELAVNINYSTGTPPRGWDGCNRRVRLGRGFEWFPRRKRRIRHSPNGVWSNFSCCC